MYTESILKELGQAVSGIREEELQKAADLILGAGQIFCDGLGRSGLSCKAFAMRLMHLGCRSYFVGETTTTAIQKGDLLLLCSGSGESKALLSHGEKAKEKGAALLLVTGNPESTLGKMADVTLVVKVPERMNQAQKDALKRYDDLMNGIEPEEEKPKKKGLFK